MHVRAKLKKKNLGPSLLMSLPGLYLFFNFYLFILIYFFLATCFAVLTGFHHQFNFASLDVGYCLFAGYVSSYIRRNGRSLILPLWQREHWGRVQKGQCDCIKATVQSNLLATIINHIHFLWIAGSCL